MSVRSGIVDIYGSRNAIYLVTEDGRVLRVVDDDEQGGALRVR